MAKTLKAKASTPAKSATATKKATKPIAKKAAAAAKPKKPRRERPVVEKPLFDLSLSINLDRDFHRVMRVGFMESGKAVAEGVKAAMPIPADTEAKAQRELEKIRKNVAKTLEKAVVTFGTRTLDSNAIKITELLPAGDNGNLATPPLQQALPASFSSRQLGLFRNVLAAMQGETPALRKFTDLPEKLECQFGTSMENGYFLTGQVTFSPNFEQPEASEVSYAMDVFAKRGKKMGMRLQFSMSHDLTPDNFSNELCIEVPVASA